MRRIDHGDTRGIQIHFELLSGHLHCLRTPGSLAVHLLVVEETIVCEADVIIGFVNPRFGPRHLLSLQSLLVIVGPPLHGHREFVTILRSAHLGPWESWRRSGNDLTSHVQILEIDILRNLADPFAERRVILNTDTWQQARGVSAGGIVAFVGILGTVACHLENGKVRWLPFRSPLAKSSGRRTPRRRADGIPSGQLRVSSVKRRVE